MTEKQFNFDPDNKVDQKHGYYMFFASIFIFSILNFIAYKVGKPKSVADQEWRWRNIFISWIHAMICGSWDLLCLILYPELMDDVFYHINYFEYLMIAFAAGYFVYDFLDLMFTNNLITCWEVTLHHIAVGSMFWYNFHAKMCIAFNVVALMAEINSFFLHSRKLLQMSKFPYDHWFYKIVIYLNLSTFLVCRGWSCMRITISIFTEWYMVPTGYLIAISFAMFVMDGINPVLFWRLFKNDVLRNFRRQDVDKKEILQNGNNNLIKNGVKSSYPPSQASQRQPFS